MSRRWKPTYPHPFELKPGPAWVLRIIFWPDTISNKPMRIAAHILVMALSVIYFIAGMVGAFAVVVYFMRFHLLLALTLWTLAGCAQPSEPYREIAAQESDPKLRAPLADNYESCRYLDENRDMQTLPLNGYDLQVLWGSVFVKFPDGRQARIPNQAIGLSHCTIIVNPDNTYGVYFL